MHPCKQVEPVFDMVKAAASFPAWKIVIKPLCPALDVLHCPFNNAFLKRRVYTVTQVQETACLRIPSATVCGNRMLPMSLGQTCDKPLRNKHVSLLGYGQCDNPPVFWLDGNPKPHQFRTCFDKGLIDNTFWNPSFPWCHFSSRFVSLNPLPNCNMASLNNMQERQCPSDVSQWQTKKVQIQTVANVSWGCPVSLVANKGNEDLIAIGLSLS